MRDAPLLASMLNRELQRLSLSSVEEAPARTVPPVLLREFTDHQRDVRATFTPLYESDLAALAEAQVLAGRSRQEGLQIKTLILTQQGIWVAAGVGAAGVLASVFYSHRQLYYMRKQLELAVEQMETFSHRFTEDDPGVH